MQGMVNIFLKDGSPFKMVYDAFRTFGFMNHEGRPWSLMYTAIHWFLINSLGILSILEIFSGTEVFLDTVEATANFATYLMILPKLIIYHLKQKEICTLLNRLEDVRLELLKDEENMKAIKNAGNFGRKLILVLSVLVIGTPIFPFIKTTIYDYLTDFKDKRLFPLIWVPWSIKETWPYIGAKIFATIIATSTVIAYLVFAILQLTFSLQMAAYLKILQRHFETKGPADRMIYQQHRVMIQLIYDYNELFSGLMMVETLVAPIMPCGYGLGLIRAIRRRDFQQFDAIQKTICTALPPFIVCVCAQSIITEVERLHEASYMNNWYEETPKVRRDLLMLMGKTLKPTLLHYRVLFKFDYGCWASVLRGLYSFFMMVINFDTA